RAGIPGCCRAAVTSRRGEESIVCPVDVPGYSLWHEESLTVVLFDQHNNDGSACAHYKLRAQMCHAQDTRVTRPGAAAGGGGARSKEANN
uniref:Uncharacterized protein n=1 Tax=Triticum urartu TaxID=4572 RepID=A0A8R7TCJ1_TRIUA